MLSLLMDFRFSLRGLYERGLGVEMWRPRGMHFMSGKRPGVGSRCYEVVARSVSLARDRHEGYGNEFIVIVAQLFGIFQDRGLTVRDILQGH